LKIVNVKTEYLKPHPKNPRIHPDSAVEKLDQSIKEFGWTNPVLVSKDGFVLAGHARLKAAEKAGIEEVPVIYLPLEGARAEAYMVADNRLQDETLWDFELLEELLMEFGDKDIDLSFTGLDESEINGLLQEVEINMPENKEAESLSLADRFLVPPFSVLDSRKGEWQERKRRWLSLGIESEVGRDENLAFDNDERLWALTKGISNKGHMQDKMNRSQFDKVKAHKKGTSVFDPVLCEIIYTWFSFKGAKILDPFAGGSVRGVVASILNMEYTGIDLNKKQIEANIKQGRKITPKNMPLWVCGDSKDIKTLADGEYDFVFSCPPYHDLEVYTDDNRDLSNMNYDTFLTTYRHIIKESASMLKVNRFACFVVGDVRDKKGFYKNFVSKTIDAFEEAGLRLYNEIILITAVGTLPITAGRIFKSGRKVGKMHQNVLVFYKGDIKQIKETFGEVSVLEMGD